MRASLDGLLAAGRVLLADGGTGTALQALGLPLGEPADRWVLDHPDRVTAVHRAFVDAGADIVLTASFGAHDGRVARRAAELAGEVAAAAARPVVVAGSVGPCSDASSAPAAFRRAVEGLREGGAGVAWFETLASEAEMRTAVAAAAAVGLPAIVTCSFHAAGRTGAGLSPADVAAVIRSVEPAPLAFGANCGDGPAPTLDAVRALVAHAPGAVVVSKPNAGAPRLVAGRAVYDLSPAAMADHAAIAVAAGARIVGGCCGVTAAHVAAVRARLDAS